MPTQAAALLPRQRLRPRCMTLPCNAESLARARALVARRAAHYGCADPDLAEYLTAELVANVKTHTPCSTFGLVVEKRPRAIRVAVLDCSRQVPSVLPIDNATDEHGRGMRMVNTVARRWGVDLHPKGKAVWFELPLASPERPS